MPIPVMALEFLSGWEHAWRVMRGREGPVNALTGAGSDLVDEGHQRKIKRPAMYFALIIGRSGAWELRPADKYLHQAGGSIWQAHLETC